ncbi:hypothetical protein J7E91_09200 [Streptomyces sp. ISL-99]|nr:hypothetical protein [Streptomyces sp. ISL-99]MBT2525606.1 hypothetical protein [Streptomyces sp. ISL-99]
MRSGRDEMAAQLFGDVPTAQLDAFLDTVETLISRLRSANPDNPPT